MNLSRDVHLLYGCQAGKSNESGDMFICGGGQEGGTAGTCFEEVSEKAERAYREANESITQSWPQSKYPESERFGLRFYESAARFARCTSRLLSAVAARNGLCRLINVHGHISLRDETQNVLFGGS